MAKIGEREKALRAQREAQAAAKCTACGGGLHRSDTGGLCYSCRSLGPLLPVKTTITEAEARDLTDRINRTAGDLWRLLTEARDREAWRALGYPGWREYALSEFDISQSRVYQLLDQGRVNAAIAEASHSTDVELSEAAARDIKPVLPAIQDEIRHRVNSGETAAEVVKDVVTRHRENSPRMPTGEPEEFEPDPVEELRYASEEIERLNALVDSLSMSDLGAEVRAWSLKWDQLNSRLQGEITKANAAAGTAKYNGEQLAKIRQALGVERNSEILSAIQALRGN